MADTTDDLSIPYKLMRPASGATDATTASPDGSAAGPAAALAPTPSFLRPVTQPGNSSLSLTQPSTQTVGSTDLTAEARTLIVGKGTSLSGEINACDRLVVEGSVRANLKKCQQMTIADTGLFNGNAAIDDAEIRGSFEGDLVVHNRLVIRATGHVSGTVSYGEIEIEAGGKISGTIDSAI